MIMDMPADQYKSVRDTAALLGVSPQRVRAMLADGELEGEKVAGVWLVLYLSAMQRASVERQSGAPFSEANAWAILDIASGDDPKYVPARDRWRARQALVKHDGLETLAARLRRRADTKTFSAHPGVLARLGADGRLVPTAASVPVANLAASGADVDAYVRKDDLTGLVLDYALAEPTGGEVGNVRLRAVSQSRLLDGRDQAPRAAIALDLREMPDARSARVGTKMLQAIQAERRWQRTKKRRPLAMTGHRTAETL